MKFMTLLFLNIIRTSQRKESQKHMVRFAAGDRLQTLCALVFLKTFQFQSCYLHPHHSEIDWEGLNVIYA